MYRETLDYPHPWVGTAFAAAGRFHPSALPSSGTLPQLRLSFKPRGAELVQGLFLLAFFALAGALGVLRGIGGVFSILVRTASIAGGCAVFLVALVIQ